VGRCAEGVEHERGADAVNGSVLVDARRGRAFDTMELIDNAGSVLLAARLECP
jgi:hypothetical protein